MKSNRIIIYAKDVQRITGKSERTSRDLLMKIKEARSKTKDQFVSIYDFSQFTGLSDLFKNIQDLMSQKIEFLEKRVCCKSLSKAMEKKNLTLTERQKAPTSKFFRTPQKFYV